jgi:Uma2 family endonuclease
MATHRAELTYEDYVALPDDGLRHEIHDGELSVTPAPGVDASRVSARAIEGAPTLAVEILSPSTTTIDRSTKLRLYARHGVPYDWTVDADARAIEADTLVDAVYHLAGRASGNTAVSLPPFADLPFVPDSLWPA